MLSKYFPDTTDYMKCAVRQSPDSRPGHPNHRFAADTDSQQWQTGCDHLNGMHGMFPS